MASSRPCHFLMILPCVDGDTDFPDPELALSEPDGLLCYGGDLSLQRLMTAYQQGIFPWYTAGEPILWWSPKRRMVLFPEKIHISKSLRKAMRKLTPKFYIDRDFSTVINHCASVDRPDHGTWIHPEMVAAYQQLKVVDDCNGNMARSNAEKQDTVQERAERRVSAKTVFGGYKKRVYQSYSCQSCAFSSTVRVG